MSWLLLPFTLPYNFRISDDVCIEYKELCKYSILFSKWDVVNEQSANTKYKEQNTEDIGIYLNVKFLLQEETVWHVKYLTSFSSSHR